ncbi:MAG: hypothetical protein A2W28_08600 [Gammaproteobacteria bacterium RBG_16_51_14]|nr:MAG: hypothetical protein A2W28_08600 [Gammaproteobacteria bacterium RBG_16_51_14]
MKIQNVTSNNRKREFTVALRSGVVYSFPYSETDPRPSTDDRIEDVFVDKELGNEAFTYILESGKEGTVHIEQVLEYHEDPKYLAELLTYKLSVEAQRRIKNSALSRRQVAKRLNTSVPQLYRLLDPANTSKSINQLIELLHILNCNVDLVVKKKAAA